MRPRDQISVKVLVDPRPLNQNRTPLYPLFLLQQSHGVKVCDF